MADRNFCEEVEIALLSDEKLTDEQIKHIESCESCRALLSQYESMKNDLSALYSESFTGGRIASSVMEEIKKEKTAIPFPSFRITHHIGTAAAVAIILVAALMIKNPSHDTLVTDNENSKENEIVFEQKKTNHVLSSGYDNAANNAAFDAASPLAEEEGITEYSVNSVLYDEAADAVEEEILEAETSDDGTDENAPVLMFRAMPKNSSAELMADSAANEAEKEKSEFLFDGVAFKKGEENFDYNVSLANMRLSEIYGDEYVISPEKLKKLGVTNAKILKIAPTITFEMFDFYKNILDVFE